jgi:hypothetical protein
MSTTFNVFPSSELIPTFQQLLDRSTTELHRFLSSIDVDARPSIHVRVQNKEGDQAIPLDLHSPVTWPDETYAWFHVADIPGGTDAYFWPVDDVTLDCWRELSTPRCKAHEDLIRNCLGVGHYWNFRRSAGQPAIINLAYGLIAASLAELTAGFLCSDDSAWDWQRMPALPDEFFSWYFVPDLALSSDNREWSMRCIDSLRKQFAT